MTPEKARLPGTSGVVDWGSRDAWEIGVKSRSGAPLLTVSSLVAAFLPACQNSLEPPVPPPEPAAQVRPGGPVRFVEIQEAAGVSFRHHHGGIGEKYSVETMGSGAGILDYDNDGHEDLYLVQGGALPGYEPSSPLSNALYRNMGNGRFRDVTLEAGARGRPYGMGFCSGDLDNDGDADIYLANWGEDVLLVNEGNGTFRDATSEAGISNEVWATSCALADVDHDGGLDIYVINYVDFTLEKNMRCGIRLMNLLSYCHPDVYDGLSGVLYSNNLDGTFTDRTRERGLYYPEGKGLGAVFGDYDNDGDIDLYVANDSTANYLFINDGNGHFTEEGLFAGVAYNEAGQTEAGMGVSAGDLDNDGDLDLYVSNLDMETNSLYRNDGGGIFRDDSFASGIGEPSLLYLAFGNNFLDVENDGDLDIFVANGHVLDDVQEYHMSITHAEQAHMFVNDGTGHFEEKGRDHGEFFHSMGVARGSATFDLDKDGDLDLLVSYNNGMAKLLRNQGESRGHWLRVRTVGKVANRDGIGARLTAHAGDLRVLREIQAGSSYCSQSSLIAHLGLGPATVVDRLEVRWPSGRVQTFSGVGTDRLVTIDEEEGILGG